MLPKGLHGDEGRCYRFWKDFEECMKSHTRKTTCMPLKADYDECLHHKKRNARIKALQQEYNQQLKAGTLPEEVPRLLTEDIKQGVRAKPASA